MNSDVDIVSVILLQDDLYREDGIDIERWTETIAFPLRLSNDVGSFLIIDETGLREHLTQIYQKGRELGVARLRTQILSHVQLSETTVLLGSIRQRLSADGKTLGSTSISWIVEEFHGAWKIREIEFSDSTLDPSVVALTFNSDDYG